VTSAARIYAKRWPLFVGIGVVFIPILLVAAALNAAVFGTAGALGIETSGEGAGLLELLVVGGGGALTLAALGLVLGASASALAEIDGGRAIGPLGAYRLALRRFRPMLGALAVIVVAVGVLGVSVVLIPLAVWLAGRWALAVQVVQLEGASSRNALLRSSELVRGRWLKVASLAVIGGAFALALGPIVGAVLIFFSDAPFEVLNLVSGVVYALAMPFVALITAYIYFDALVRERLEPDGEPDVLPSELPRA
jgi:hypothetical protein